MAVLRSCFRTKNGTHTTLTLIPNLIKSVIESFFIVKEMIWLYNYNRKLIPLSIFEILKRKNIPFLKKHRNSGQIQQCGGSPRG